MPILESPVSLNENMLKHGIPDGLIQTRGKLFSQVQSSAEKQIPRIAVPDFFEEVLRRDEDMECNRKL
jgi:hypothetical protein